MINRFLPVLFVFSLIVAVPAFGKKDKIRHYPVGGIKGWYVVMLPAETEPQAFHGTVQSLASTYQLNVTSTWERFKGFLAEAPIEAVERLANDARVASIEQDHFGVPNRWRRESCSEQGTADWRKPNSSEIAAGSCFYGYSWHYIQGAAASTARMIRWGRTCP